VRREEAATDDHDQGSSIGVRLGPEDVHGQGGALLAAVDHVLLAGGRRLVNPGRSDDFLTEEEVFEPETGLDRLSHARQVEPGGSIVFISQGANFVTSLGFIGLA